MFFNAASIDRFLFCNYGAAANSFHAIQDRGIPEGCAFKGGRSTQGKIENDRWYEISLVVGRDRAEMLLDGKKVSDARVEYLPEFFATAGYDRKNQRVVMKATNYRSQPVRTEIQIEGATTVGANGQHILIRSDKPTDENSLDTPRRIVPQALPLPNCASSFPVILPPYSVNVLLVPARRN
jgi:alpha-L-arabinofuranosidase